MSRGAFFLAAVIMLGDAQATELGRLFYTPMQRQELDRKRLLKSEDGDSEKIVAPDLIINGRMSASGGRSTTWVNGVPTYDRSFEGPNAKVGQSIDPNTGEVKDPLRGGKLVIKPSR